MRGGDGGGRKAAGEELKTKTPHSDVAKNLIQEGKGCCGATLSSQGADLIHGVLPSSHDRVLGSWMRPAPLTGFQWYAPSEWLARLRRRSSMELPRSSAKRKAKRTHPKQEQPGAILEGMGAVQCALAGC